MPTKNPRMNVVVEKHLYEGLRRWGKRDGVPLSLKMGDLVRDALESEGDRMLVRLVEKRVQSFDRRKALTHDQVWSRL